MNTKLSSKLIQHLLKNNNNYGFTFWKLTLVTIVIGFLIAIILHLFLRDSVQVKKISPPQNVNILNKAQQAYFLENKKFTQSLDELGSGVKPQTTTYNYSIKTTNIAAYSYAVAKQTGLHSFVGGVFLIPNNQISEMRTIKILCESDLLPNKYPANPILKDGVPVCAEGTKEILNKEFIK